MSERALHVAIRVLDSKEAVAYVTELANDQSQKRRAIVASGVLGDPRFVPWLLEQMTVSRFGRIAGEAFSMITGADFTYEKLEGQSPPGFRAGPTENPDDHDVALDPDERLPWPDCDRIRSWWNARKEDFPSGNRYLNGKPVASQWLFEVLRFGRQRQRASAALELALRRRGTVLFEVRAKGTCQQLALASLDTS
jgi:uncharacterized protein (TIGR02270 family)